MDRGDVKSRGNSVSRIEEIMLRMCRHDIDGIVVSRRIEGYRVARELEVKVFREAMALRTYLQ